MSAIVPSNRPAWPREKIAALLVDRSIVETVVIVGVRGYYRDSMGKPGTNDVGIYDDALFVTSPHAFVAFNANTDPSRLQPEVAVLRAGLWHYKIGIHGLSKPPEKRYRALVQAAPVTVDRYKDGPDTGWFGINIHRGSYGGTSSLGCQTLFPDQWSAFFALVEGELQRAGQQVVPYLLIEQQG